MRKWVALIGISLLAFTAFLDVTIVNTALPFIQQSFEAGILELQWVTNIFIMMLAVTMVAAGRFADLHGRKLVFYWGVAIFAVGAIGAGASEAMGILIFFRAVQGLGASILFVSSASMISHVFPEHQHGRAIGIYSGITGLGLAAGPALGGFLVGWLGWRWVFWINLPFIFVGALCCACCLRLASHVKSKDKIDAKGLTLLLAGLSCLIFGIIQASDLSYFWLFVLGGALLLFAFYLSEKKSQRPLVDFSIFKKNLILLCILNVASGFGTIVYMFFDPLYLKIVRSQTAYDIGFMITAIPIGQIVISTLFEKLQKWIGIQSLQLVSIAFAFIACVLHSFIGAESPLLWLLIPFFILGLNWGMINTGVLAGVGKASEPAKIAEAIGSVFTMWNVIGSIMLALCTGIFHMGESHSFMTGFRWMSLFSVLVSFLFLAGAFSIAKRKTS